MAFPLCHADVHDVVVTVLYSSHNAVVDGKSAFQRKVSEGWVGVGKLPL